VTPEDLARTKRVRLTLVGEEKSSALEFTVLFTSLLPTSISDHADD
jgi:hypothetical protein